MSGSPTIKNVLRDIVAPLLGMAMFWPLFRHASYFMVLFPSTLTVPSPFGSLPAHAGFLAVLALLVICAMAQWPRIRSAILSHRTSTALVMSLGSVAALIQSAPTGTFASDSPITWVSIVFVAIAFLTSFIAWTERLASTFDTRMLVVLGGSFLISFVLFSRGGLIGHLGNGVVAAAIMPVGTALLWFASSPVDLDKSGVWPIRGASEIAPVLVVAAFLVIGAAVRGIVDVHQDMAGARSWLSVALASAITLACCAMHRCLRPCSRPVFGNSLFLFALTAWLCLAVLFMVGLFVFLVIDNQPLGGDIVVVSRTMMEFVLCVLLCDLATRRSVVPTPLFLACGMSVELLSWLLSYAAIPQLLNFQNGNGGLAPDTIVLTVLFSIILVVLLACGCALVFKLFRSKEDNFIGAIARNGEDGGIPCDNPAYPTLRERARDIFSDARLTQREVDVTLLFASGHSLAKVAEELNITKSTAQTHIKNAYRKLDVHSRDELNERLER